MSDNHSSTLEFQTSIASLWEDLTHLTKEVVAAMNQTDELRSKTGGLECHFADLDEMVVTNQSSPSMDLTIRRRSAVVHVHTRTIVNGIQTIERETRESFTIQSDESGASLRNREGEVLTMEQAVFQILRPFLHLQAIAN